MSEIVWLRNVRCLRERIMRCERSYARTTIATPPAWKSGSTVTISPLNSCCVVVSSTEPSLTSSDLPIWNFESSRSW